MGTCMLGNAPEAWFISDSKHKDRDAKGMYMCETFGLSYSMHLIVAIVSGQLSGIAATTSRGPTRPL
jgi:hypothetical protein